VGLDIEKYYPKVLARQQIEPRLTGDDLPHSRFTRRQKELFDFPADDSGKTVYFCVRFENAKGEPGPWGGGRCSRRESRERRPWHP
jgi:hypothetical protein